MTTYINKSDDYFEDPNIPKLPSLSKEKKI